MHHHQCILRVHEENCMRNCEMLQQHLSLSFWFLKGEFFIWVRGGGAPSNYQLYMMMNGGNNYVFSSYTLHYHTTHHHRTLYHTSPILRLLLIIINHHVNRKTLSFLSLSSKKERTFFVLVLKVLL